MSLGDGSGLSAADIMALASNNNDGFGAGFEYEHNFIQRAISAVQSINN